jgi:2-amino-4-hydroxy-6-hydroxymethyldihydropteridine diphosphokinase
VPLCFIGIGSNIEPERHVAGALQALHENFGPLLISTIRQTAAVGFSGAAFLNLVAAVFTQAPARRVIEILTAVEARHGRTRSEAGLAARTLDLDLLLYGDLREASLKIPRPEIAQYAFVLEPLAEIAPALRHPELGRPLLQLWNELKTEERR